MDEENGDTQPNKRQRVSLACNACQRKKIKCSGGNPCSNCQRVSAECVYKKNPRKPRIVKKPKKATNIGELENRLERIESLLESLAPKHERDDDDEDDDDEAEDDEDDEMLHEWENENIPITTNFIKFESQQPVKNDIFSVSMARGVDHFCTNGSVFALFTNNGMKWVSEKTGDKEVPQKLSGVLRDIHYAHQMQLRPFVVDSGPPPVPEKKMLKFAMQAVSIMPPLITSLVTMEEMNNIFDSANGDSDCVNGYAENFLMFSLLTTVTPFIVYSEKSRKELGMSEEEVWKTYHGYTEGAMYYYHRSAMIGANMTVLKALLLYIIGLQPANAHPVAEMTPTAIRFAHELGLHRWESCHGLTTEEANRRRVLWWLTYCLDRDSAMKTGRGPSIMDFDISMGYPARESTDSVYFLVRLAKLFKIWGKVYERLFSAQAANRQPAEIVKDVCELDAEITQWKDELPPELQPGAVDDDQDSTDRDLMSGTREFSKWDQKCGSLHLHYCYYQILSTVHRITAYHPSWIHAAINDSPDTPNSTKSRNGANSKYTRLFSSLDICVQAARSTIELIRVSKRWDRTYLWGALYFSANSFITLFIKCIARPKHATVNYDLGLMQFVLESFSELDLTSKVHRGNTVASMSRFWSSLYDVASGHVQRAKNVATPVIDQQQQLQQPQPQSQQSESSQQSQLIQQQQQPMQNSHQYQPQPASMTIPQDLPIQQQMPIADDFSNPNGDASLAQSLYQVSSYFYNWDQDFFLFPSAPEAL